MLTDIYLNGTAIINASALTTDKRIRKIGFTRKYLLNSPRCTHEMFRCIYTLFGTNICKMELQKT